MKLTSGVYENLISEQLEAEKRAAEQERLVCIEQPVDSAEHPRMIADYISHLIQQKLDDENLTAEQIKAYLLEAGYVFSEAQEQFRPVGFDE